MKHYLKQLFDSAIKGLVGLSALLLALIIFCVAVEVLVRAVFNRPQAWVLEFSEYALLFITFLTAAFLLKKEKNITIDIVTAKLNLKTRLYLSAVHYVIISMVSFVFVYFGGRVTLDLFERGIYNPTIMQVQTAYVVVIIPIGGFFLLVQSMLGLYGCFKEMTRKSEGAH